jgi:hypothetical protein
MLRTSLVGLLFLAYVSHVSALRIRLSNFGEKEGAQTMLSPISELKPPGPKRVAAGGWRTEVVKVTALPSRNAISWTGENKIYSNPKWCITPPPFGEQCTLFKKDAIFACTQMENCNALACADPTPYLADPKYKEAVCQPRTTSVEDLTDHAGCIGSGGKCENIKIEKMSVQAACAHQTLGRGAVVELQMLSEVEDGDIVLDYKPGEGWYEGALERALLADGWHHVKFRTPNDQVRIAGQEFMFLRFGQKAAV